MVFNIFKKSPEKILKEQIERESIEKKQKEKAKFKERFSSLALFQGNLQEYQQFVRYECEIIDTGNNKKYVEWKSGATSEGGYGYTPLTNYPIDFQIRMYNAGIEALILYKEQSGVRDLERIGSQQHVWHETVHQGTPVRKKQK